ncbi:DMT family transporter [Cognatishimia sp. SS12]|uniref:DMT family transporter n=1 Tax=Cognatishimia sp. SS12 TaxID=2979465 RepID=UPI00232F0862|nr:DMT family transporter [Cognatishimia sp. SS12]MDC0739260.1 DMT family transporter [Cognatishimia sp. SS12]
MALRYWLCIFVLAMGWGASFFFNEILLRELGPLSVGAGRVGMGALGCWLWLFATGRAGWVDRASVSVLIIFAAFQYAIPLTVYPLTQQYITSSAAGIVNALTPVMVVLISHFWPKGEKMTVMRSIGVLCGFLGIVLLALPSFGGRAESDPIALLLTISAPICYALALNVLRKLDAMGRVRLTAWSLTFSAIVLCPMAVVQEGWPVITQAETWIALVVIGFVLTSAAFILLFWLIPIVGGTTASTITFIAPISSVLLGVLVLNETLLPIQLGGMAVIFVGLLFVDGRLFRRMRRQGGLAE